MNQALSGKWLWRIGEDGDNLWKRVFVAKYGFEKSWLMLFDDNIRIIVV